MNKICAVRRYLTYSKITSLHSSVVSDFIESEFAQGSCFVSLPELACSAPKFAMSAAVRMESAVLIEAWAAVVH